mmetsp:Transcript_3218/g.6377  ORF Transcript_3218/g.6377 Transcript_3218/m.6377 type:complete len:224 (+) Transcript_3218:176-847(+)
MHCRNTESSDRSSTRKALHISTQSASMCGRLLYGLIARMALTALSLFMFLRIAAAQSSARPGSSYLSANGRSSAGSCSAGSSPVYMYPSIALDMHRALQVLLHATGKHGLQDRGRLRKHSTVCLKLLPVADEHNIVELAPRPQAFEQLVRVRVLRGPLPFPLCGPFLLRAVAAHRSRLKIGRRLDDDKLELHFVMESKLDDVFCSQSVALLARNVLSIDPCPL